MAPVPTGRPLLNMEQAQASRLTRARVLLHHLDGAMDAGHAGALAVEQLLMTLPPVSYTPLTLPTIAQL